MAKRFPCEGLSAIHVNRHRLDCGSRGRRQRWVQTHVLHFRAVFGGSADSNETDLLFLIQLVAYRSVNAIKEPQSFSRNTTPLSGGQYIPFCHHSGSWIFKSSSIRESSGGSKLYSRSCASDALLMNALRTLLRLSVLLSES